MAKRRMFSLDIVDTDRFLDLPLSAQALYFHLGMRADDDGFISSPKRITKMAGSNTKDLDLLIDEGFIIQFDSGVCVIADWRINNSIRKDRHCETVYTDLKSRLKPRENGSFELVDDCGIPNDNQVSDNWDTQVSIDKGSIDEGSIGEGSIGEVSTDKTSTDTYAETAEDSDPQKQKYGEYQNVLLSDEDIEKLKSEFPYDWRERIERLSEYMACKGASYSNHLATIRSWAKRETPCKQELRRKKSKFNNFENNEKTDYDKLEEAIFEQFMSGG